MSKKHCPYVKYQVLVLAVFIFLLIPVFVSAQTNTSTESLILQLQQQIKNLQIEIQKLQAEVSSTKTELELVKTELKFTKALRLGTRGEEVTQLQEFLKQFPDIYPQGLVTGYFGPLTEAAVRKFQEKNNIESIGVVGPKTLSKLNELVTEGAGKSEVIPPGLLIAPGLQKKLEPIATTTLPIIPIVSATTTPSVATTTLTATPTTTPSGTTPATPATPATPTSVSSTPTVSATPAAPAQPATTTTTTTPTTDTTTPIADTTFPVISGVGVEQIKDTSAVIFWTTNEPSGSDVDYGFTSSYGSSQAGSYTTSPTHKVTIVNLQPSTVYHYRVKSRYPYGNFAVSPDYIFTTSATYVDTTPPVISITGPFADSPGSGGTCKTHFGHAVDDNVGISEIQYKVDGVTFYSKTFSCGSSCIPSYGSGSCLDSLSLADGNHTFTIFAKDTSGNITTKDSNFSISTPTSATSTSFLTPRSQNLSAISQMLNSLDEIIKQLSQLLK